MSLRKIIPCISANKNSSDGASKDHRPDYDKIAQETAAAIATQDQLLPMVKNESSTSNPPPPANKQQPPPKPKKKPRRRNKDDADLLEYRCLMFFPTSGHMGFEAIKTSMELPSVEVIRDMIAYEICIRLCEPIQDLIDVYHKDEAAIT